MFTQKDKARTRLLTRKAVKRGRIKKRPCKICGSENKIQPHHPDYSQPLKVVWLCAAHHTKLHASIRKIHGEKMIKITMAELLYKEGFSLRKVAKDVGKSHEWVRTVLIDKGVYEPVHNLT